MKTTSIVIGDAFTDKSKVSFKDISRLWITILQYENFKDYLVCYKSSMNMKNSMWMCYSSYK